MRECIRMTIVFIELFTLNLPVYSTDSYGITKSYQMGIPETASYQIRVCSLMCIYLGVLSTKKMRTTGVQYIGNCFHVHFVRS